MCLETKATQPRPGKVRARAARAESAASVGVGSRKEGSPCGGHHVGPRDPCPLGNQRPQQAGRASPGPEKEGTWDRTPSLCLSLPNRGQKRHSVQSNLAGGKGGPQSFCLKPGPDADKSSPLPGPLIGSVIRPWPHGGRLGSACSELGSWGLCPSDLW